MYHTTELKPDSTTKKPIYTKEGLYDFLSTTIPRPHPHTAESYAALSPARRATYDKARLRYINGGILVTTADLLNAQKNIVQLSAESVGEQDDHYGLMFSGDPALGKTTITKALMRYAHTKYLSERPNYDTHRFTPVVYIVVPTACTPKSLMEAFAYFFGMTVGTTETADRLKRRVVDVLNASHTQLVVVDDLQNLGAANRGSGRAADVMRQVHHSVQSTFIYAGVDLRKNAIFDGVLGQQLLRRYKTSEISSFNMSNPQDMADWGGIIAQFEANLLLHDHVRGTLPAMASYLHDRTGGHLGSLKKLLTGTAVGIINDAKKPLEAVTRERLAAYTLDDAAETYYAERLITLAFKKAAA